MLRWSRLMLWAALVGAAAAQVVGPITPPGGTVRVLAANPAQPEIVLLGTATGAVFRSSDGGEHWRFFSQVGEHDDWVISSLVPDGRRAGRWYASLWSWTARNGGVFESNDGGATWTARWLGHAVRELALAPSNDHVLVAAALDGVYRSEDAGRTWARISPAHDRELENVESVAIDPSNPQEIYVGTWHLPWKTINGGHDWWQMRQGVIDDSDVFAIAVDHTQPSTLYLSACSGIYRSEDRGNQFRKIQGIPYSARRTPAIVQDPHDAATIYAGTTQGLWVSHDRGNTWQRITSPQLSINSVLVLPHRLLLGTNFAGVIASSDGGASFSPSNDGFSSRHVAAAAWSPEGTYLSITGDEAWGGVFRHAPDGAWEQLPALPERAAAMGLHWSEAGLVAATARGIYWLPTAGKAAAQGWEQRPGMPTSPLYSLASLGTGSEQVWAAGQLGLYHSGDGGLHWTLMREAPAPAYRVFAAAPDWVWLAGNGYVVRSDDGGRHFLSGRLSLEGARAARIRQLTRAPRGGGRFVLLAATTAGLYQSGDGGATWTLSGHGLPALDIAAVHVTPAGIFAFASDVGQTYRSMDGGQHWEAAHLAPAIETDARMAPVLPLRLATTSRGEAAAGASTKMQP